MSGWSRFSGSLATQAIKADAPQRQPRAAEPTDYNMPCTRASAARYIRRSILDTTSACLGNPMARMGEFDGRTSVACLRGSDGATPRGRRSVDRGGAAGNDHGTSQGAGQAELGGPGGDLAGAMPPDEGLRNHLARPQRRRLQTGRGSHERHPSSLAKHRAAYGADPMHQQATPPRAARNR